uniref:HisKA domain-containing protein n=1 Tax=Panagrellus redivivus TaxID=6233 RepID=A0A7E4ZQK4_PANRE
MSMRVLLEATHTSLNLSANRLVEHPRNDLRALGSMLRSVAGLIHVALNQPDAILDEGPVNPPQAEEVVNGPDDPA